MPVNAPTAIPAMARVPMEYFLGGGVEVADAVEFLEPVVGAGFVDELLELAQPMLSGRVTFSLVQSWRLNAMAAG